MARDEDDRTSLDLAKKYNWRNKRVLRTAAKARRKAHSRSGPGFLDAAIGIIGGTAVAIAGGGSDEAVETGAVFVEGVIGGEALAVSTASTPAATPSGNVGAGASGGRCEIPGYPRPSNPRGLGLSWCPASVDFQVRVFALTAAGAKCAIALGNSSTPNQIKARRDEIEGYCERLAALDERLGGSGRYRCPAGY